MTSVSSVSIGALTLLSDGSSRWKLQSITGWYDGPTPRINLVDRPTANGAFQPGVVYRSARAITITGFVTSPNPVTGFTSDWATIAALATDGNSITLTVVDPAGTMTSQVWLAGSPVIHQLTDTQAQFQVQFVAPDPIKYGQVVSGTANLPSAAGGLEYNLFSGGAGGTLYYGANGYLGRVTLQNLGTAQTYPMLSVTGGLTAGFFLQVLETGEKLSYPRVMTTTDTIFINNRTGRALVNNQSDITSYFDFADFFGIPAGATRTLQFNAYGGSSGTPHLNTSFSPGYW